MKIGIVTHPLLNNYGGILQNYALQQTLKDLGHLPITIDYIPLPISKIRYALSLCKSILLYPFPAKRRNFYPFPKGENRDWRFSTFINENITTTPIVHHYSKSLIQKFHLDALIVGSDQVWRAPFQKQCLYDMYLEFARHKKIKKIAYAASFGVDNWEYSHKQTKKCKGLIKYFNGISVREDSGIKLCELYLNVNAVGVSDPTLLLSPNDYCFICNKIPKDNSKFLIAYVLDMSTEKQKIIRHIANTLNLEIRLFTAEKQIKYSIEEWLAMFRDASYVVTDSFHGSVFSILFNVKFYSLSNKGRGMSRLSSLFNRFDLTDRLIDETKGYPINIDKDINWNNVNIKIQEWRNKSIAFLQKNL